MCQVLKIRNPFNRCSQFAVAVAVAVFIAIFVLEELPLIENC